MATSTLSMNATQLHLANFTYMVCDTYVGDKSMFCSYTYLEGDFTITKLK